VFLSSPQVREELDRPREFFLDRKSKTLYYFHNATAGTPPPADGFVATRLRTLLQALRSPSTPVGGSSSPQPASRLCA
jgi:hypothetical protein